MKRIILLIYFFLAAYLLKAQEVKFVSDQEIVSGVEYLNKLRHSTQLVKQETGVDMDRVTGRNLTIDSSLTHLAKLRVIEMAENDILSHKTKYDTDFFQECCAWNYEGTVKSHIIQYIIDEGVENKGHRKSLLTKYNRKVGIAVGEYEGKHFSCILLSDGAYPIVVALK